MMHYLWLFKWANQPLNLFPNAFTSIVMETVEQDQPANTCSLILLPLYVALSFIFVSKTPFIVIYPIEICVIDSHLNVTR